MHITLILTRVSILLTLLTLANVRGTSPAQVIIPTYGEIIYPNNNNTSGMFGNTEVGDEFTHTLLHDIWGSIFEAPEDGYAKNITVYVKNDRDPSRVRCSLYEEFKFAMGKYYFRFVMATEEKIIPAYFEGWVTFNFTSPPPISKGVKYWINGWAGEGFIFISTKLVSEYLSTEWTSQMVGDPQGLSYRRFYEIIPQGMRLGCLCSIYCTYEFEKPTTYKCPYCGTEFPSYEAVLEHIMTTPLEMIHLQICDRCGYTCYLKEEMQLHNYEKHGIGSPPEYYSCIFCNFTADTPEEVYTHINDNHAPFTEPPE